MPAHSRRTLRLRIWGPAEKAEKARIKFQHGNSFCKTRAGVLTLRDTGTELEKNSYDYDDKGNSSAQRTCRTHPLTTENEYSVRARAQSIFGHNWICFHSYGVRSTEDDYSV